MFSSSVRSFVRSFVRHDDIVTYIFDTILLLLFLLLFFSTEQLCPAVSCTLIRSPLPPHVTFLNGGRLCTLGSRTSDFLQILPRSISFQAPFTEPQNRRSRLQENSFILSRHQGKQMESVHLYRTIRDLCDAMSFVTE